MLLLLQELLPILYLLQVLQLSTHLLELKHIPYLVWLVQHMAVYTLFLVDTVQFNLQLILELLYTTGHGLLLELVVVKLVVLLNTALSDQLLDNQLVSLFQQMQH